MAKKDFSNVNTGSVYDAISEATAQDPQKERKTYTEQEAQELREAGKTQGRKGVKATRINMAFSPTVHDYIRTMARVRGESVTEFTEAVFKQHMEANAETYEKAKAFIELI